MTAAHMPAMASCWQAIATTGMTWSAVGNCALLSASITFFLLKFAGARFLRFRATRQSGVAFCVLVAFMHFDAIRTGEVATLIPEYTSIIVATIVAGRALALRRDLSVSGSHEHRTGTLLAHDPCPTGTVWTDNVHPRCWTRSMRVFALRAPPA
jgi:hypothetical protein